MKNREAQDLAEDLGYRFEKFRGEDKYLIRDLHTDTRVAHGLTFAAVVEWLQRARAVAEEEGRAPGRPL